MIDDIVLLRDGDDRGHDRVDLILPVQAAACRPPDGVDKDQAGMLGLDQLSEKVQVVRVVQVPTAIGFLRHGVEPDSFRRQPECGGAVPQLVLMTVPTDPERGGLRGESRGLTVWPCLGKPDPAGKVQPQVGLTDLGI